MPLSEKETLHKNVALKALFFQKNNGMIRV
jgi:hypothetical protein